jgi:hypothetical protein
MLLLMLVLCELWPPVPEVPIPLEPALPMLEPVVPI